MSKPKNMVYIGTTCNSPSAAKNVITSEARKLCEEKGLMVWDNSCVQIDEVHWRCEVWLYNPDGSEIGSLSSLFF